MSFAERFDSFACEGDTIRCEAEGFTITAQIVAHDCPDAPDQRQNGFWPSLYKDAPGFIGPGNGFRQRFAEAQAKAEAVMEAWRKGEWFYCGIVLSVERDGIEMDSHAASLWGVECNYPGTDNSYLTTVANELLPEALGAGRAAASRLAATVTGWAAT
ncbi:hypothetical protein [Hyphomonas sp. CY54-11-8]|uniref:hypothetical protein n=1 Tax=Hyphomonas sp. CY54-11-8 TaxID=1280944 RepID=UPI0004590D6C|nr:hypothetical protein [Hyphomonas sp. CY54-11-8]KCZ45793.1 hypothetical protein HY17_10675 [Hyphomonas sp. CY54-11-8]